MDLTDGNEINPLDEADRLLEEAGQLIGEDSYLKMTIARLWLERIQAKAAERQAAALERIADSVNSIDIAAQRSEDRLTEIEGELSRIAAVLERADNLSQMFGGEG
jgi:hypothetical protein